VFLNQNFQHKAILINSAPQKMAFAFYRNNDFIQVPFITKAWGTATDFVGIVSPELLSPFADRFVGTMIPR
jgi:hypothetical protein